MTTNSNFHVSSPLFDTFDECRVFSYIINCLFCDLYLTSFLQKIHVFWCESNIDTFHTQNINHNVLSRSIRYVEILCYLSDANTTIFKHSFSYFSVVIVNNCGGLTPRQTQIFDDFTTFIKCFVVYSNTSFRDKVYSPKHFCYIFNDFFLAVIPLETQNIQQTNCSV